MALTPVTFTTVEQHIRRKTITRLELGHPFAHLHHFAGEFMAHRQRRFAARNRVGRLHRDKERPVAILFQIGATDATGPHPDNHLTGTGRSGRGNLFNANIVAGMPTGCFHGFCSSICLDQVGWGASAPQRCFVHLTPSTL